MCVWYIYYYGMKTHSMMMMIIIIILVIVSYKCKTIIKNVKKDFTLCFII